MKRPTRERVAYFNGIIVPESQVLLPFRDRGFLFGDAVFDTARTFGGRVFKLHEHVERLYRSLRYTHIDPGLTAGEMKTIAEEVLERNVPLLAEDEDYWVYLRVSRGVWSVEGEEPKHSGSTVIVECTPLPLKARARCVRDGIDVIVPALRRIPEECLSPRVKSHNYLNLILGDLAVKAVNPDAWAVLADTRGNLAEGYGCNIFTVHEGRLCTPKEQSVLAGTSRETVMELARGLDISVLEKDLDLFDVSVAEEVFLTSTSICICGVRSVNGSQIGDGDVPGPVTKRLIEAYIRLVEYDFVAQYLSHLNHNGRASLRGLLVP